jgi:hypothetical protein
MQQYKFDLFADYHQFYLQDEGTDDDLPPEAWTDEAIQNGAVLTSGTIWVQTARNMRVPVIVEVHAAAPENNFDGWDKVFECSLDVPSGKVVVAGCTDSLSDAARIEVVLGPYKARIYYGDLATLSEDGLDGDDHYKVVLWPAPLAEAIRLK